jgi:hypothetical protein
MADDMVILVCPRGAENGAISHGEREFKPWREDVENPNSRWLVRVPRGIAAYHFCRVGGFVQIVS